MRFAWAFFGLIAAAAADSRGVITGDYIEDRSNHVYGCYCEWSGEGEFGGREVILAWRVRSGEFQGTDLAGVKMAVVIQGEGTLSRGEARRNSVLFVDRAASKPQQRAAEALVREKYGELTGPLLGVYPEEIEFDRDTERAVLRIGHLLNVDMRKARLPEDALQGAITWYEPFTPLTESILGTTLRTGYQGSDFNHQWSRSDPATNGYFGRFELAVR